MVFSLLDIHFENIRLASSLSHVTDTMMMSCQFKIPFNKLRIVQTIHVDLNDIMQTKKPNDLYYLFIYKTKFCQ